jgi:hypothetical protein
MTTPTIQHVQGNSFRAAINATVNNAAANLTGWTVASEIRQHVSRALMPGVTVTVTSAVAGAITVAAADTSEWPTVPLDWDIKMTDTDGNVTRTESISINCVQGVTA